MLKKRILSAVIAVPIFLLCLFKLSSAAFALLTLLLTLVGAWEWSALMGVKPILKRLYYVLCIFIFLMLLLIIHLNVLAIFITSGIWWLFATVLIIRYPAAKKMWSEGLFARSMFGMLVLIPTWVALNFIRNTEQGIHTLLFLFILIWGADTGAYFAGRLWGRRKLAPQVSPGKTVEGVTGALITSGLICLLASHLSHLPHQMWWAAIGLGMITVIFSIIGDLFESMLKRNVNLKDSGNIMPGHGGILDRIDSLTAAAPIFVLGILAFSKYYY